MGFFKRLFGKEEKVDEDLEMVRYAIKHNVAIIVGNQITYNKMRGIDQRITVLRIRDNFTFEVRNARVEKAILHHTVSEELREWIDKNTITRIVEMEK
ncbi:hypothetical protein Kirov_93 [Bacillus phage Kirov]|uniref:Uncharacterized protein n=1 Tax=Bacillus phage Kirov TaxID=2783539 RepID=A0A7U3NJU5_9CAUD|nr:hypothetical protein PQE67_gp211 [Bacillus phage Kirov]QOV08292.1 hypothetical protein Kirov_93 [Bacillus phage Kirov]